MVATVVVDFQLATDLVVDSGARVMVSPMEEAAQLVDTALVDLEVATVVVDLVVVTAVVDSVVVTAVVDSAVAREDSAALVD